MPRSIASVREWEEKKKHLGGLPLYREFTVKNDPTRRVKDPTPHFAFRKVKDDYGRSFPRQI